jgi:hypothetical protein
MPLPADLEQLRALIVEILNARGEKLDGTVTINLQPLFEAVEGWFS